VKRKERLLPGGMVTAASSMFLLLKKKRSAFPAGKSEGCNRQRVCSLCRRRKGRDLLGGVIVVVDEVPVRERKSEFFLAVRVTAREGMLATMDRADRRCETGVVLLAVNGGSQRNQGPEGDRTRDR
jgi:hypothetical protein